VGLADSPRGASLAQFVVVFFVFLSCLGLIRFFLGFCCSRFADGPSFSSGRSGSGADCPPSPCKQSVFPGLTLVVLVAFMDCLWHLAGLSAWPVQTVRPSWPDSPPVLGSFAAWFDSSLLSFVLPRVFQGIVPKT
jgi:hypothetical protein